MWAVIVTSLAEGNMLLQRISTSKANLAYNTTWEAMDSYSMQIQRWTPLNISTLTSDYLLSVLKNGFIQGVFEVSRGLNNKASEDDVFLMFFGFNKR